MDIVRAVDTLYHVCISEISNQRVMRFSKLRHLFSKFTSMVFKLMDVGNGIFCRLLWHIFIHAVLDFANGDAVGDGTVIFDSASTCVLPSPREPRFVRIREKFKRLG